MALPQFEDIRPIDAAPSIGYHVTNEEPWVLMDMLKKHKTFKKSGGIASGGEVPLFVMLPRCKQVTVVDHCYRSLLAFWTKVALLDHLGPQATKDLFTTWDVKQHDKYKNEYEKIKGCYPEPLAKPLPGFISVNYPGGLSTHCLNDVRREWHYIPDGIVARAAKHLDKLKLIHGDLSDLEQHGPFDLLYTSNAHEHMSQLKKKNPTLAELANLVAKDGLLLASFGVQQPVAIPNTETVIYTKGYRTTWWYGLYRKG